MTLAMDVAVLGCGVFVDDCGAVVVTTFGVGLGFAGVQFWPCVLSTYPGPPLKPGAIGLPLIPLPLPLMNGCC